VCTVGSFLGTCFWVRRACCQRGRRGLRCHQTPNNIFWFPKKIKLMHCCPLSFVFFLKWTSPLSLPNFKRNQIEFPLNPRDPCESTRLADFALPEGQTHPSAVSILLFFLSFFYFACASCILYVQVKTGVVFARYPTPSFFASTMSSRNGSRIKWRRTGTLGRMRWSPNPSSLFCVHACYTGIGRLRVDC